MRISIQTILMVLFAAGSLSGQVPGGDDRGRPPGGPGFDGPPPGFNGGPRGGGFGGPGPMQEHRKVLEQFDKDGDKHLNAAERKAAREFLAHETSEGRGPRRPGGFRGRNQNQEPPSPGPKLTPAQVKTFPDAPLYDSKTLRTVFLEFEDADWEKELAEFFHTDVDVPAKLLVDGKTLNDVGVHFRGASSFFMVGEGRKRSLNLSLDYVHDEQRLGGYRTLNLLNSHEDPTFLRTVLYCQIARNYLPAPKANFMRVVINGESWGIYVNSQQFNKEFVKDWFGTTKGARWKVQGSPRGRGGLEYLGETAASYQKIYSIKSKDDPKSWAALIRLCKTLNQTPASELEKALEPMLDVDGALKFLALENVFINDDGYWIRSSDYNIYLDEKGRFHILPHDVNETFSLPGGPGFGGGPGGGGGRGGGGGGPRIKGVELDPLVAANDASKPLLSKLLAVSSLRKRYLGYVREIASQWLDWNKLNPLIQQFAALIGPDIKTDTRKLDPTEEFTRGIASTSEEETGPGPRRPISLKNFVEQRRTFLLNYTDGKKDAAN